jgi:hypothetical protein
LNSKSIRRDIAGLALFLGGGMVGSAIAQDTSAPIAPVGTPTEAPAAVALAPARLPEAVAEPSAPAMAEPTVAEPAVAEPAVAEPAVAESIVPKSVASESTAVPPIAIPPDASACCTLADGTPVSLEIAEPLTSKTAQPGQRFKLRLAVALQVAEGVLLPAGTTGEGEVIHADRARAGGKPGEILLAARFLNGPGGMIKLRGMKLGGIGKDHSRAANAVLVGTTVAAPILAPVALLVRGGNLEIPVGMPAQAKLAGPHQLPLFTAATTSHMEASGATQAPTSSGDSTTPDSDTSPTPTPQE